MKQDYIHQPMKIGKKEISARIVLPPMATGKTPDGKITEELCDYYEQRAKNPNVGLIITEHSFVAQQGKAHDNQVSAASDDMIPGMKMLADRVHGLENGTCIIMQISHAGGVTTLEKAETLLEQEKADLIGIGRALLKNPNLEE